MLHKLLSILCSFCKLTPRKQLALLLSAVYIRLLWSLVHLINQYWYMIMTHSPQIIYLHFLNIYMLPISNMTLPSWCLLKWLWDVTLSQNLFLMILIVLHSEQVNAALYFIWKSVLRWRYEHSEEYMPFKCQYCILSLPPHWLAWATWRGYIFTLDGVTMMEETGLQGKKLHCLVNLKTQTRQQGPVNRGHRYAKTNGKGR